MLELLAILGGGSGLASLFGVAVNLHRGWKQSILEAAAKEARHKELIAAMERQTEALGVLSERVTSNDERHTSDMDRIATCVTGMDKRLSRVEVYMELSKDGDANG